MHSHSTLSTSNVTHGKRENEKGQPRPFSRIWIESPPIWHRSHITREIRHTFALYHRCYENRVCTFRQRGQGGSVYLAQQFHGKSFERGTFCRRLIANSNLAFLLLSITDYVIRLEFVVLTLVWRVGCLTFGRRRLKLCDLIKVYVVFENGLFVH